MKVAFYSIVIVLSTVLALIGIIITINLVVLSIGAVGTPADIALLVTIPLVSVLIPGIYGLYALAKHSWKKLKH